MVRVLTWNIGHGGGTRVPAICAHIGEVRPDMLALTEFRVGNEPTLRRELHRLGYRFIVTSQPQARQNGLLVASVWRLDLVDDPRASQTDRERWLTVRIEDLDLNVCAVHIPGGTDTRRDSADGVTRKEAMWRRTLTYATSHAGERTIIMGDFNTGLSVDAEGSPFVLARYMQELLDTGYVDSWRHQHPEGREYTWYSKRKDPCSGETRDLNGFRLDYIFLSPPLKPTLTDTAIVHRVRTTGASDHAGVVADLNVDGAAHRRPEN